MNSSQQDVVQNGHLHQAGVLPLIRFWARFVDMTVVMTIVLLVLYLLLFAGSGPVEEGVSDDSSWIDILAVLIISILYFLVFAIIEAVILSIWGTTPGKRLLRIHIANADGSRLSTGQAFSRSLDVFCRGWACGLSILAFGSLAISYLYTKSKGIAPWDRRLGLRVSHGKVTLSDFLMTAGLIVLVNILWYAVISLI